jgi:hypothetical protein
MRSLLCNFSESQPDKENAILLRTCHNSPIEWEGCMRESIAFPVINQMPCKCGGTKWLMMIQPADPGAPDDEDHDQRTYECPRCEDMETLAIKFR